MIPAREPKFVRGPFLRLLALDKRWQLACAGALVLGIVVASSIGPLVRYVATARAAALGLELAIGRVRPGWFSVQLKDSDVRLSGVSAVQMHLDAIQVDVGLLLGLQGVEVRGGNIALAGPAPALADQLRAWRRARSSGDTAAEPGQSRTALRGSGITVEWNDFEVGTPAQKVSGIRFERTGGVSSAGFDAAELETSAGRLTVHAAKAQFDAKTSALRAIEVERVIGRLELTVAKEDPSAAPDTLAEPPRASAATATDTDPSEPKSPSPNAPPSALERWIAPFAAGNWATRRDQLAYLGRVSSELFEDGASVSVGHLRLEIARGKDVLNIGPAPLRLERQSQQLIASFTSPRDEKGQELAVTLRLPLGSGTLELNLDGGPVDLETLGVREGDFGLLGVDRSELTLATLLSLSPEGLLGLSASGELAHLSLEHPALAPEPLSDVHLNWGGQVRFDLAQRKLLIQDGVLGLERVRVLLDAELEASETDLRAAFSVRIPKTPCQDLLQAAPRALLPQLEGLELGGTFALDSRVRFDTKAPKEPEVEWNFENRCQVKQTPAVIDPDRFREPFQHSIMDAGGSVMEMSTGPTTEQWVPFGEIPKAMETALIVCEDSRFFAHDGFDNKAIRDSIIDNLRAGRFVRGASTLSMQLAKNLYLGREKTLSRKLQEAAFTLLLEERLNKQEILELYLNVVEFAPGVYGIRNAARHYFNAHPGELSVGQALFLGSILPSPKANHFGPDKALRPRWAQHLQYLMRIAHKIKRITDEELAAGLNERIIFGEPHPTSDSEFLFGTPLYEGEGG